MRIHPRELKEEHLGKAVELKIPFDTIKGKLTDFYGSFDEKDNSVVIIEIDEEPYFVNDTYELIV